MKVQRWGDDLAVKLPRHMVNSLGLREGDDVAVTKAPASRPDQLAELSVETSEARSRRVAQALARLAANASPAPPGFRFDRDEANER